MKKINDKKVVIEIVLQGICRNQRQEVYRKV